MKRLFNLFLAVVMIFSFTCIQVYAANGTGGSGNIDGGGGSMGDATSHGSWNPGNEGVRVTVVRASDHAVVTTPFDLTNKTPSAGIYHFGKVSKIQYNNGNVIMSEKYFSTFLRASRNSGSVHNSKSAGSMKTLVSISRMTSNTPVISRTSLEILNCSENVIGIQYPPGIYR